MNNKYIVLAIFAVFVYYELIYTKPVATTVTVPQNPLGIATAPPSPSVAANSSVLSPSQSGYGFFGNPTGLGNNPVPQPTTGE